MGISSLSTFWSNSHVEEKYFITFFQDLSSDIRISIVKFLTTESSKGGNMNELLQLQQNEITTLQNKVVEQNNAIQQQNNEISIWKRRYTRISFDEKDQPSVEDEIESFKENLRLRDQINKQTMESEEILKEKNNTIETLENDVKESQAKYQEMKREKELLQEELHALSTTYSSLEQMYNAVLE